MQVIGGVVDLFYLLGPSPAEVVAQYAAVVGLPAFMPYWSLGFHNCRSVQDDRQKAPRAD